MRPTKQTQKNWDRITTEVNEKMFDITKEGCDVDIFTDLVDSESTDKCFFTETISETNQQWRKRNKAPVFDETKFHELEGELCLFATNKNFKYKQVRYQEDIVQRDLERSLFPMARTFADKMTSDYILRNPARSSFRGIPIIAPNHVGPNGTSVSNQYDSFMDENGLLLEMVMEAMMCCENTQGETLCIQPKKLWFSKKSLRRICRVLGDNKVIAVDSSGNQNATSNVTAAVAMQNYFLDKFGIDMQMVTHWKGYEWLLQGEHPDYPAIKPYVAKVGRTPDIEDDYDIKLEEFSYYMRADLGFLSGHHCLVASNIGTPSAMSGAVNLP